MAFFIVTMAHEDDDLWHVYAKRHMEHLHQLVANGTIRASGGLVDEPVKTGCFILTAKDRPAAEAIVAQDPFARNEVISRLTITEWDPFVGIFASESSGKAPTFD